MAFSAATWVTQRTNSPTTTPLLLDIDAGAEDDAAREWEEAEEEAWRHLSKATCRRRSTSPRRRAAAVRHSITHGIIITSPDVRVETMALTATAEAPPAVPCRPTATFDAVP